MSKAKGFLLPAEAQRAKFARKVHKPSLGVNVINFESNEFNLSNLMSFSGVSQSSKSYNALMEVSKICGKKRKIHFCL